MIRQLERRADAAENAADAASSSGTNDGSGVEIARLRSLLAEKQNIIDRLEVGVPPPSFVFVVAPRGLSAWMGVRWFVDQ